MSVPPSAQPEKCSRPGCGHDQRGHTWKGDPTTCSQCGCHAFVAAALSENELDIAQHANHFYGNAKLSNPDVTREMVDKAAAADTFEAKPPAPATARLTREEFLNCLRDLVTVTWDGAPNMLLAHFDATERELAEAKACVNVALVDRAEKLESDLAAALLRVAELEGWFRGILAMRPKEVAYDEFAYQRMVTSFHDAARKAIARAGETS
jgi:hypothetical protein